MSMRRIKDFSVLVVVILLMSACGHVQEDSEQQVVEIKLSDESILVDNHVAEKNVESAVYVANDIVYYEEGKDISYGEGSEKDAHSVEEASEHTVVHITEPGVYSLSGTLSRGQIAVDLGEDAKDNSEAIVTLILNEVDITCQVAPAVIFYNVYECGNNDTDKATKDVDTSSAGANVIIADGTENTINGSYVEKIYKADSVVLNEEGTNVEEAEKLHKYDGAFYSCMSMNITGEKENSGVLNINAENEGLDSEMHLTINGGNINIQSGNDGINTNEDGVSVTTINGGNLTIKVTGETGEGDGIDSNGWLVINGGNVSASACSDSADAGIDSDMGIHINGGTVIAAGHMLDRIEEGGQTYAVFNFAQKQDGTETFYLKNEEGNVVLETKFENAYSVLVYSSSDLKEGTYTLWSNDRQLNGHSGEMMRGPENNDAPGMRPEHFEGMEPPEGFDKDAPPGEQGPEKPDEEMRKEPNSGRNNPQNMQDAVAEFQMKNGANMFGQISCIE